MSTIYVETSVLSYLTARLSSNLVAAAWQKVTAEWWDTRRNLFELFISELVVTEAGMGDSEAATRRLDALRGIPMLSLDDGDADA